MKNILILVVVIAGCTPRDQQATTSVPAEAFILDSLFKYNSEAALAEAFGSANIARDTAWLPEGMGQYMVTLLYPGTRNEVSIAWDDSVNYAGMVEVTIYRDSADWRTHDIKVGTTLTELVRINGADFTFSGFGWDYGGYVMFGEGSKMADVTVALEPARYDELTAIERDSLLGDQSISSKSPVAVGANPVVMSVRLTRPGD